MGDPVSSANLTEELLRQAAALARAGQKAQARRVLAQAIGHSPHEARIYYLLGQLSEDRGEAQRHFEHALELSPGNPEILKKLDGLQGRTGEKAQDRRFNQLIGCSTLVFLALMGCITLWALVDDPQPPPAPTPTETPYWLAPTLAPRLIATLTTGPQPTITPLPCDCYGPDLDCKDFTRSGSAGACFRYCQEKGLGDVFRLDGDSDGRVCEAP